MRMNRGHLINRWIKQIRDFTSFHIPSRNS